MSMYVWACVIVSDLIANAHTLDHIFFTPTLVAAFSRIYYENCIKYKQIGFKKHDIYSLISYKMTSMCMLSVKSCNLISV